MASLAAALAGFAARHQGAVLRSTSAALIDHAGPLYNVTGSTADPRIDGQNWKRLLIGQGIAPDLPCYVDHPPAGGRSHPGFDVGGHMTPNPDGRVARGETCYLMPLCAAHNSTAMNGRPFTLARTRMLRLSGFMLDDLALTFAARMVTTPYAAIHGTGDDWQVGAVADLADLRRSPRPQPQYHLLLRRRQGSFVIVDHNLPAADGAGAP